MDTVASIETQLEYETSHHKNDGSGREGCSGDNSNNNIMPNSKDECVGSLLIHQSDMKELSSSSSSSSNNNVECVGSLVVPSKDMQELTESSDHQHHEQQTIDNNNSATTQSTPVSLVKRLTNMKGKHFVFAFALFASVCYIVYLL